MFKNCFNNFNSKDDLSNNAISRLSQCSFPTSEISLELDYYDYITPFVPKAPNLDASIDLNSDANTDPNLDLNIDTNIDPNNS